jgi:molybdopterin molybdotransferase
MPAPSPSSPVLTFEDARRAVEAQAAKIQVHEIETLDLIESAGRALAEPISADRDIPPFARATRDGYAVRASDLANLPATLNVVAEIRAGAKAEDIPSDIALGQAASIMTGAPVPSGADAVVMIEYTTQLGDAVQVTRGVATGENVVPKGAEAPRGRVLLAPGTKLTEAGIALLASVGKAKLRVYTRPRVAILTTGDEIVGIERQPGPTQIRNSNSYSLAVQIQQAGGEPVILPIAPDEAGKLRPLIEEGLRSDLLILTGGVSMGRYDLVEQVLTEMKAEFFFTGAKIQPGRPVVFGRVPRGADAADDKRTTYFFGLPGNPISTMVTFELFARPMLEALSGMIPSRLAFLHARLKSEIRVKTGLKRFLPALLSGEFEKSEVELVAWQGSGDIAATTRANCYIVVPPDIERIKAGEWVAVMMR